MKGSQGRKEGGGGKRIKELKITKHREEENKKNLR